MASLDRGLKVDLDSTTSSVSKSPECITPSAFDTHSRRQSAKVGIFNLISTMIGGGALSLPFAVSRCGLILGFSLLILSAFLSVFSFDILIATARRTGAMTYQQIGYHAFGPRIALFVTLLIWFNCFIASIAYCVLIGDLLQPVVCFIGNFEASESLRRLVIAISIGCVSPFCYMRQIGALKFTSIVSVLSICVLTAIIIQRTASHFLEDHTIYYINTDGDSVKYTVSTSINLWPQEWKDVVYVFPVFGIAFLCHFNIPQVHSELTRPTRKRIKRVLTAVVMACFLLYGLISFFGYFFSFEYTCANILLNYYQNDPVVTFGRMCLGFVILFTFPLLMLPARQSLHNVLNECGCICSSQKSWMNLGHSPPEDAQYEEAEERGLYTEPIIKQLGPQHTGDLSVNSVHSMHSASTNSMLLKDQYDAMNNHHQVQTLNTKKREDSASSMDWNRSLEAADVHYSLTSDVNASMSRNASNGVNSKRSKRKSKDLGFTTRSFSTPDSPLRNPKSDVLGVINEPNDILLLQEKEFVQPFKNLESSVNYAPSRVCLVIETTIMILASLCVSFLTKSVMVLWGLLGSSVGFMIAFALPGLFYYRVRAHKGWTLRNVAAVGIVIMSGFAMVLCTWQAIVRLDAESCPVQPTQN